MGAGTDARGRVAAAVAVAAAAAAALFVVANPTERAGAQAACNETTVKVGIVTAKGCFAKKGEAYTATEAIELNGFTLTPTTAAPLVIDVAKKHVTTRGSKVGIAAGDTSFDPTAFDFDVPSSGKLQLFEVHDGHQFGGVIGLPIASGAVPVSLTEQGGEIDVTVGISGLFKVRKLRLSSTVTLDVVPGKGVVFDGAKLDFGGFSLGPFRITKAQAEFSEARKEWSGELDVGLPPDGTGIDVGFKIKDSKLVDVKVGLTDINLELVDGVFLQRLIGALNFDGTIEARLTVGVSAGPEIDVFGRDIAAVEVDGFIDFRTGQRNGFFELGGDVKVVSIEVASADFKVYFSGGVSFAAGFGTGFPSFTNDPGQPFYVGGRLGGWIKGGRYEFDGTAELKAAFVVLAKGEALISDKGAAVCGKFFNRPSGGGAYSFPHKRLEWFPPFTCGIGKYRESRPARAELAATGSTDFNLGRRHNFIRLESANGEVPAFRLEGPGGRVVEHRPWMAPVVAADDHVVVSTPDRGLAHVVVPRPSGRWTLTELEGGPPIVAVAQAGRLPEPRVAAEVRGRGARRTVVWEARRIPRQRLQFNEVTPDGVTHPIFSTWRDSGRRRFEPLSGDHYGRRKLEVAFQQRISQRDTTVADRYRVNRPRRPGKGAVLRAQRVGYDTVVRWRKVRGASGYRVAVVAPDGGFRFVKEVGPGRRQHVFEGIPDVEGTRAEVRALNRDGRPGPAARRRVAFTGAAPSLAAAAKRTLRTLRARRNGDLALRVLCPEGGECRATVAVRAGGRRVATARRLPVTAGTARRATVHLPARLRRLVRGPGLSARVRLRLDQLGESVARSRQLELGRDRGSGRR